MENKNPIHTLGDYSKPSHEGYRNTIELPVGNNVVPLRSDTIRLVQNGSSFHGLQSEDPDKHIKDFLKLVDSLDLDVANRERTHLYARLSKFKADFKQQQGEMTNKIDTVLKAITNRITGALLSDTVKNLKLNVNPTSLVLSACSYPMEDPQCSTRIHSSINAVTIYPNQLSKPRDAKPGENKIAKTGATNNDHHAMVRIESEYFIIIEDISSIIDLRSGEIHYGINEIAYKMSHKIELYNSLSNLEKENTKSVYLRNEEEKRRGVEYVINKILRFHKECLELGTKYLTGVADEGEVT
ncbi:hypothetical protein Tco_0996395 [Tanacetum coccineum]